MRAAGGAVQRYVAGAVPSSPEDLSAFLREELAKLQSAYNALADGQLDLTTVAPAKPRDGMTRYAAAGVLGALAGMYSYYGGAWHFADSGMERGSNANGDYVRFPDGTQICYGVFAPVTLAPGATGWSWTYPAAFSAVPYVSPRLVGGWSGSWKIENESVSASGTSGFAFNTDATNKTVAHNYMAIGRWY